MRTAFHILLCLVAMTATGHTIAGVITRQITDVQFFTEMTVVMACCGLFLITVKPTPSAR